jgi:hypothetical protein
VYTPKGFLTSDKDTGHSGTHTLLSKYIKGEPHKYRTRIFELCEAKSGYESNLAVYAGAHPTA